MSETNTKVSDINIDNLLDLTLDDLEDLPEFKAFPPGAHRALAAFNLKEINKTQCVELALTAIETLELAEPTKDTPIKAGDCASLLFMLNNEFGRGAFKAVAKPMQELLKCATTRQLIDSTKDIEVIVVTSLRKDKNDSDKFHMQIKELQVV